MPLSFQPSVSGRTRPPSPCPSAAASCHSPSPFGWAISLHVRGKLILFSSCPCFHRFILLSFVLAPRTLDFESFQEEVWPLREPAHHARLPPSLQALLCEGSSGHGTRTGTSAGTWRFQLGLRPDLLLLSLTDRPREWHRPRSKQGDAANSSFSPPFLMPPY